MAALEMTQKPSWWRDNAVFIVAFVGYALAAIVFAINIRDRVDRIEQFGSPQVAAMDKRLALIEQQINYNNQVSTANGLKLDTLGKLIQEHLIKNPVQK